MSTRSVSCFAALFAALVFGADAWAQQPPWPSKPIRVIVPTTPGAPPDLVARVLAEGLTTALDQPVIVDNRAGAGHIIGTQAAARAAPDGYTYVLVATPHVVNPSLHKNMPYDTQKDLEPVTELTSYPMIVVVNAALPVNTVRELVDLAKAKPGQLNMASAGIASGPHLAGEFFKLSVGINLMHVPYKGGSAATSAMLTGEANLFFDAPTSALVHMKTGKMRALAVTSRSRLAVVPDVPTMAESGVAGVAGFDLRLWTGLVAPAGTPKDIIARMQAESAKVMALPHVKSRYAAMGTETVGSTPEQFSALIDRDMAMWRKVVKDTGMSAD